MPSILAREYCSLGLSLDVLCAMDSPSTPPGAVCTCALRNYPNLTVLLSPSRDFPFHHKHDAIFGSLERTSMRTHCLSSRRGGWSLWQRRNCSCPSRYASIRTFCEPTLWWLGAYDEIRLDSGSTKALQSSERPLFLSDRPSPCAHSPLEIRSDRASRARPPL
jgi:hypothetical protein